MSQKRTSIFLSLFSLCAALLLSGCEKVVLDPKGPVGVDEKWLIITSTIVMLIVVVPVIVLTVIFAYRYRATSTTSTYAPTWSHSYKIEVVIWGVPFLLVTFLGILAWKWSHDLDPYKPLQSAEKPVNIDVVSLDWKWLFVYPDQKVAVMNQVAFPTGVPVHFNITSDSVMNSFFIPQIGSQIYAMAGMRTELNLQASHTGSYEGISAMYSGAGFSDMKFQALALSPADFAAWVKKVQGSPAKLTLANYPDVAKPSMKAPVEYFASAEPGVFQAVIDKYMGPMPDMKGMPEMKKTDASGAMMMAPGQKMDMK